MAELTFYFNVFYLFQFNMKREKRFYNMFFAHSFVLNFANKLFPKFKNIRLKIHLSKFYFKLKFY